jgi:hypothetical protein
LAGDGEEDNVATIEVDPKLPVRADVDSAFIPIAALPFKLPLVAGKILSPTMSSTTSSTSFSSVAQIVTSRLAILS